jgi:phosphodiesterase/alkaline phosphatase D-like protein
VDSGGNAVVTGGFSSSPVGADRTYYYTAKYAAVDGALLWEQRYGDLRTASAQASSVVVGSGLVAVTGTTDGYPPRFYDDDYLTIKYLDGPTPHTLGAEVFSPSKARISGAVNPNGFATDAALEYGTVPTLTIATTATTSAIGNGSAAVAVGVTLTTLRPRTQYFYRAIGTASGVTLRGEIMTFTTPPAPTPVVPVARPTPRPLLRR